MERNVNQHILLFVLLSFIFSCSSAQSDSQSFKLLTASEFKKALSAEEKPQLIDVRTENEFKDGSINGAVNYNILDGTFSSELKNLKKNEAVFVFCAKGGRSNKAAKMLKDAGFKKVYDLKGGYGNWRSSTDK